MSIKRTALFSGLALFALAAARPTELRKKDPRREERASPATGGGQRPQHLVEEPRGYARSVYRPEKAREPLTDGALVTIGGAAHVTAAQYKDLSAAAQHLLDLYPPDSHYFIGLGRDPAPLTAFLQNLGGKDLAINFPASSNESGEATTEILAKYVKKLIPRGVLESGRTIVFFDVTSSGRALDLYVPLITPSLKGAKVIMAAFDTGGRGVMYQSPGDKKVIDTTPFPEVKKFYGGIYENVVAEYPRHGPGYHDISDIAKPLPGYQQYRDAVMQRMERDEGLARTLVELGVHANPAVERSIARARARREIVERRREAKEQQREAKEQQRAAREMQRAARERVKLHKEARAFPNTAGLKLQKIVQSLKPTPKPADGQPDPFLSPNAARLSTWLIETLAQQVKYAEVDDQLKKDGPNPYTFILIHSAQQLLGAEQIRHRDHRRLLSQALSASVMDRQMLLELARIYEASTSFRDTLRAAPRFFTGKGKHEEPATNIEANYRALMETADPQFDINAAVEREKDARKEKKEEEGDRAMRVRKEARTTQEEKNAIAKSHETKAMSDEVGRQISAFIDRQSPYSKEEGGEVLLKGTNSRAPRILYLHGSGETTDNELLRRIEGRLRDTGVGNDIVSMAWDRKGNMTAFENWLETQEGPFVLAGHSAGGGYGKELLRRHPGKFTAAFFVNPAAEIGPQAVPTLVLRGAEDPMEIRDHGGANVTIDQIPGADHSLRHRPGFRQMYRDEIDWPGSKTESARTPQTHDMNLAVAARIRDFLDGAKQLGN